MAAGYINARKRSADRWMDIFNEVKLIFIMYHLMTFTDFVSDPKTRTKLGLSCCVFLILGTLANMLQLIVEPIK